jgi:hypothetical protein
MDHLWQQLEAAGKAAAGPLSADPRRTALARLAAAVALGAAPGSLRCVVDEARAASATDDDMVGTLRTVAATIGLSRVVAVAPGLALALGYDVDAAFEESDGS